MHWLLSCFLFISLHNVFAQTDEYVGGNGGDDDEIMIKNTLMKVGVFLDSSEGKSIFKNELDSKAFIETTKLTDIRVVDFELVDKFNLKRCALNFPERHLAVFNRNCLDQLRNNVTDLYVLLTHEILNIMGLELPDEKNGSVYTISSKIGSLGALVISRTKDTVISAHCRVEITNLIDANWETPRFLKNILKDKGYEVLDFWKGRDKYELQISLLSKKYSKFKVEGNKVIFESGRVAEIQSSFLKRKFNGLVSVYFDPAPTNYFAPAPVWVERLGIQYEVRPLGFWKESLIEIFMKLPSCIKY